MDSVILITLLAQTLRIATPLIFSALGGIFSEKSGHYAQNRSNQHQGHTEPVR